MNLLPLRWLAAAPLFLLSAGDAHSQGSHTRGLWVGEITLDAVNEVSVPLDANNVPIAPNPAVTTPTSDLAHLRVILHVNGAGQVSLLRDVAILDRIPPGQRDPATYGSELDLALVTDELLFPDFPAQPAKRIASVAFEFGDSNAKDAVDAVVALAAESATAASASLSGNLSDPAVRGAAVATVKSAALARLSDPDQDPSTPLGITGLADQTARFDSFLRDHLRKETVTAIATGSAVPAAVTAAAQRLAAGVTFTDTSGVSRTVLADPRGNQMIAAVQAAAAGATAAGLDPVRAAQNAAAAFADLDDLYGRFLAGGTFGFVKNGENQTTNLAGMIRAAAEAGAAAKLAGADPANAIRGGSGGSPAAAAEVTGARIEALRIQTPLYDDRRASAAVEIILDAMAAEGAATSASVTSQIVKALEEAASDALANTVPRYHVAAANPTHAYTGFIRSGSAFTANQKFSGSLDTAAAAAAAAAVEEKANPLSNSQSILRAATLAANHALAPVYTAAARAARTEQGLAGSLAPGGTLTGTLTLPGDHPTNPFRHRRHPDHTRGFDILRHLTFTLDGAPDDPLKPVSFGVDQLTGVFEEEIHGLHKPLGPQRDIGLKVSGRFVINRISLIDTLNAR